MQAPCGADGRPSWCAWGRAAGTTDTHQTSNGVLDFKPRKEGEYVQRYGQGKCNMALQTELDPTFALDGGAERPDGVTALLFDALILAEGEVSPIKTWSPSISLTSHPINRRARRASGSACARVSTSSRRPSGSSSTCAADRLPPKGV